MLKEVKICDYCIGQSNIATYRCHLCGKDICRDHSFSFYLFDIKQINLCSHCRAILNKMHNDDKENIRSNILNMLRKAVTIESID